MACIDSSPVVPLKALSVPISDSSPLSGVPSGSLIDAETPTFAFLDVNLGFEMSYPIADRLRLAAVPYVFATGYGDEIDLPPAHQDCPVVKKPYTAQTIAAGAASATSGRD